MARKPGPKASTPKPAKAAKATKAVKAATPAFVSTALETASTAPRAIGGKTARTIVYIHGIANKPPADVLKCQWDKALFGNELGDRSRMAYWVNREYYPVPLKETCADADQVRMDDDEASTRAIMALASGEEGSEPRAIQHEIDALSKSDDQRRILESIAAKMEAKQDPAAAAVLAADVQVKILPGFLRNMLVGKLTRALLRDVNDFLFVPERRAAMENSLLDRLKSGGGPFVVVAHSQGTMVAYNLLRRLDPAEYDIPLFVTIGSPLGLAEVQDQLRKWTGQAKPPFPPCVKRWVNVAEQFDPVAFDSDISDEFQGKIENYRGFRLNPDWLRHPHSGTGYLRTKQVRQPIYETVGNAFGQAIAPFVLAKDLVSDIERGQAEERHPVLIQLVNEDSSDVTNLDASAEAITNKLNDLIRTQGGDPAIAEIDRLRRFLSARLTRSEAEVLRTLYKELSIKTIWRNGTKQALIVDSTNTIQARPANLGYGADGHEIAWAVLDTGIRGDHPHFIDPATKRPIIVEQYDCMEVGPPRRLVPGDADFATLDGHGHGTHVAGIIGGAAKVLYKGASTAFRGMAPVCRLYGFKVLGDDGRGSDAAIIKALDMIAQINERAGRLVIAGVNLSLGGAFDPAVYGCGHTPLCQEIKRLWRQGVLSILAAGNEGYAVLRSDSGAIQANMDLSIGDPANLEEAIAVGSVHKTNPHTYGISYFSSRGPTADGRVKPDVVAPGERIISARHDWTSGGGDVPPLEDLYVEMSGTSMAAPHVSGLLASFLSQRREFIGEPDRVKRILLNGCVDLARDRYMQGAGLPNLIKMLALE
ncbi:serine peptidase [Sphingomonas sp. DBB INV C78]|uniref:S8 family serine peptidase n=1 Tax=Sphingomonas sp. DBB INV C78 TaxID=3349434 RepID=UPI0036D3C09B